MVDVVREKESGRERASEREKEKRKKKRTTYIPRRTTDVI